MKKYTDRMGLVFGVVAICLTGCLIASILLAQTDVDPDGDGPASPFSFANPDFDFRSIRFNAVFRWEWRLGSTLYVAWTQRREDYGDTGAFDLGNSLRSLARVPSDNTLVVKVAYWFSR